jgi:hypothetical protein
MSPIIIIALAAAALAIYAAMKNQNPVTLLKDIFGIGYTTTTTKTS